jgi:pimeloyl-ACP methyl ester carboxylesterase
LDVRIVNDNSAISVQKGNIHKVSTRETETKLPPSVSVPQGHVYKALQVFEASAPAEAAEGTIHKEYALAIETNSIHGSDSPALAASESPFSSNWEYDTMHSQASTDAPTTAYLDIDGMKIRYKAAGVGEQVLLLHGWGCSIETMGVVFDDFAQHYAVVALDFPGHGKSDLPPKAWGVSDFSECLLRVMDALHIQRPHIIAHSHGGRVTIKLAVSNPERVGKIVLVNSAGARPPRTLKYCLRVFLAKIGKFLARDCGRWGANVRSWLYRAVASKDYANAGPLRDTFVKLVNEDLTPKLCRMILRYITSPTLLIWGENDTETPVSSAVVMRDAIPYAELVILKNAGHFSYIDQYGKFRLIVSKFLRDVSG